MQRCIPQVVYPGPMSKQLAIRFADDDIAALDELVELGVGGNRPEIVRRAVSLFAEQQRRQRANQQEIATWTEFPETDEEMARAKANGIAYCDAEDWSSAYPPSGSS